jgi:hypothetical protein
VDPLPVFGGFRKQRDPFLGNVEPFRNPNFLANQFFQQLGITNN